MLTSTQLADELGLAKSTILKLAKTGSIPCIQLPTGRGDYRFDLDEVKLVMRATAENSVTK